MKRSLLLLAVAMALPVASLAKSYPKLFQKAADELSRGSSSSENDNAERLFAAFQLAEQATQHPKGQPDPRAWVLKAKILYEIAFFDPEYDSGNPAVFHAIDDPEALAEQTARHAIGLLQEFEATSFSEDDCWRLVTFCDFFRYRAEAAFGAKNYYQALDDFRPLFAIVETCRKAGFEERSFYWYGSALAKAYDSAIALGLPDESNQYLHSLYLERYAPIVFTLLYQHAITAEDPEKAVAYLTEGVAAFPEDLDLLHSLIDHDLLRQQFTPRLVANLEKAAALRPDLSVYHERLAGIHLVLCGDADSLDAIRAHYSKGLAAFEAARQRKADSADLFSTVSVLHYQLAVHLQRQRDQLEDPVQRDVLQAQIKRLHGLVRENLVAVEIRNPSNLSNLQALESFLREQGELELADLFAARIATLQAGGTIENSYFASEAEASQ